MTSSPSQPAQPGPPEPVGPSRDAASALRHPAAGQGLGPAVDPELVGRVTESILSEPLTTHLESTNLPSRDAVDLLTDLIRDICFPGFFTKRGLTTANVGIHVQELLSRIAIHLEEQVRSCLRYMHDIGLDRAADPEAEKADLRARAITRSFLDNIPELRRLLALDVHAAFDGDPAATHTDETIFCYPGIDAVFSHRVAHHLYQLGVPLLPRILQEMAHSRTGIDIHPGATIAESFFIDHGGGVVIGETTHIGHHVRVYQGVTLGAKSFEKDDRGRLLRGGKPRHPTIGNHVTIYAGAVILGGDTVIGDHCVISGSVFVTESVPPGHLVRHNRPELVLRSHVKPSSLDAGG
jgi:serine O-acetyltransferase